jgi:putative colanic acid biosynthesis UDP-glucose lipid carrier transferase
MLRHRVKAGMTGWAQVHGLRQNTPLDKRIEFDIYYIQNWTFKLDLEILWRTVLKFRFVDKEN